MIKVVISGVPFYVSEQVLKKQYPEFLRLISSHNFTFARNIHCFTFIHHYIQGYNFDFGLDFEYLYHLIDQSGLTDKMFFKMLLQDCAYYKINSLFQIISNVLIDLYPELLPPMVINKIVSESRKHMDKILLMSFEKTKLLKQIDTEIEEGLLELSSTDLLNVEQIRMREMKVPYVELIDDINGLRVILSKRVQQKVEGILPQFLIWLTTIIYRMLDMNPNPDAISGRVKTLMRNNRGTIRELYDFIGQFGWQRVETIVDYSSMICTDASV